MQAQLWIKKDSPPDQAINHDYQMLGKSALLGRVRFGAPDVLSSTAGGLHFQALVLVLLLDHRRPEAAHPPTPLNLPLRSGTPQPESRHRPAPLAPPLLARRETGRSGHRPRR